MAVVDLTYYYLIAHCIKRFFKEIPLIKKNFKSLSINPCLHDPCHNQILSDCATYYINKNYINKKGLVLVIHLTNIKLDAPVIILIDARILGHRLQASEF